MLLCILFKHYLIYYYFSRSLILTNYRLWNCVNLLNILLYIHFFFHSSILTKDCSWNCVNYYNINVLYIFLLPFFSFPLFPSSNFTHELRIVLPIIMLYCVYNDIFPVVSISPLSLTNLRFVWCRLHVLHLYCYIIVYFLFTTSSTYTSHII